MSLPMTKPGSNGRTLKQAGWLIVTETHEVTRHYECAAWYQKVRVEAGSRVPLWRDGNWFVASIPGIITGSNFTSRLGACHGKPCVDEDKGKSGTAGFQADSFTVAQPRPNTAVELLDHWRVDHIGEYSTGKPMLRAVAA